MEFLQKLKNSFQHITKTTVVWLWIAFALLLYWLTCTQGSWSVVGHQLMTALPTLLLLIAFTFLREHNILAGIPFIVYTIVEIPTAFSAGRQWIVNIVPLLAAAIFGIFYMYIQCHFGSDEDLPVRSLTTSELSKLLLTSTIFLLVLFVIGCTFFGEVSLTNALTHANMTVSFIQHVFVIFSEVIGVVIGFYLLAFNVRDGWLFAMMAEFGSLILNNGNIFGSQLGNLMLLILCVCAYFDPQWKPKEADK